MKIVVVGLGYVGLANAVLLAQKNDVISLDISDEKVDQVNKRVCPVADNEVTNYFETKKLKLRASNDFINSFKGADFIVIATPTNYDSNTNSLIPRQ